MQLLYSEITKCPFQIIKPQLNIYFNFLESNSASIEINKYRNDFSL